MEEYSRVRIEKHLLYYIDHFLCRAYESDNSSLQEAVLFRSRFKEIMKYLNDTTDFSQIVYLDWNLNPWLFKNLLNLL